MTIDPQQLRKPVVAVHRAVEILGYLGRAETPAGVQEIARALDIVPSTCLHILRTLAHDGMVTVDAASKRYRLGPALLRLARDMVGSNEFLQAAQPLLDRVAAAHGVTAAACWLESRDRVMVVAKSEVAATLSINVSIGSRFPSLVSAIGICLAANEGVTPQQQDQQFAEVTWQNPPDRAQWAAEVERARETGCAVDPGFFLRGVTILAAPVFDAEGSLSRFLVAVGFSQQLRGGALTAVADGLKAAARSASEALGADAATAGAFVAAGRHMRA